MGNGMTTNGTSNGDSFLKANAFNIITILLVFIGALINYGVLTEKVDNLDERLQQEVIDRKVEDKSIRLELDRWYDSNAEDHKAILEALKEMNRNLTFHLGQHEGTNETE